MLQLDFLPVGDETRSGDAIIGQFFDGERHRTIVVDGGFADTSEQILQHLDTYYGGTTVDLVVSTHPDDDHIRGLLGVVRDAERVGDVWVHLPSEHGFPGSDDHKADLADELAAIAWSRGATVSEPFAGLQFANVITVAGPTQLDYEVWLGKEGSLETKSAILQKQARANLYGALLSSYGADLLADPGETLDPGVGTTPRNMHSVILNISVGGDRVLLTGDAGAPALHAAADNLENWGLAASYPWLFQIPHHGSRRNLSPDVLDRLLGTAGSFNDGRRHEAIASVAAKAKDHPRGAVSNAVRRRGCQVFATRGKTLHCNSGYSERSGWGPAGELGWLDENL